MTDLHVADRLVTLDDAVAYVRRYALAHPATLRLFDRLGTQTDDTDRDQVTMADIGRLVVINAAPRADDVPFLLAAADADSFGAVPMSLRLEACEPGSEGWKAASDLYERFRGHGIGRAKRSKLLHAKRPSFFPISDSVTGTAYERVAGRFGGSHWEAMRADLLQPEWTELMRAVADLPVGVLDEALPTEELTSVRVLDIVAWSEFSS